MKQIFRIEKWEFIKSNLLGKKSFFNNFKRKKLKIAPAKYFIFPGSFYMYFFMVQIQLYPSQTKNKYRYFQAKCFEDSIPSNVYSIYILHFFSPTYIISILNEEVKIFSRKKRKRLHSSKILL